MAILSDFSLNNYYFSLIIIKFCPIPREITINLYLPLGKSTLLYKPLGKSKQNSPSNQKTPENPSKMALFKIMIIIWDNFFVFTPREKLINSILP